MSKNWAAVPTCLPIGLRRRHTCAYEHFRANDTFRVTANHKLLNSWLLTRTERPAWQSPYGPPPRRARRGRWAPVPGVTTSRSAVRRGHLSGRGD